QELRNPSDPGEYKQDKMPKGASQNQIRNRLKQNANADGPRPPPQRFRRGGGGSGNRWWNAYHLADRLTPSSATLTKLFAGLFAVIALIFLVRFVTLKARTARLWTPVPLPTLVPQNGTSAELSPDLFWGTYRPQLYFGLKHRSPHSLLAGLMWFRQDGLEPQIRHWCEQSDRLRYSWDAHDGRNFGSQSIRDEEFAITTEFVKRPKMGGKGGDWTARISTKLVGVNASDAKQRQRSPILSVMFYFLLPDSTLGHLRGQTVDEQFRLERIQGHTKELGEFQVNFRPRTSGPVRYTHLSTYAPREDLIKETVMHRMTGSPDGTIGLTGRSNMKIENLFVFQMTSMPEFQLEVSFESVSGLSDRQAAGGSLQGETFSREFSRHEAAFNRSLAQKFGATVANEKSSGFVRSALSNMLGGIGYFYGSSIVNSPETETTAAYWPAALFSATPSRSFFPRGFLWDEGFHNLLIGQFDPEISRDILAHWLDLMNVNGWIPREQILGFEAKAKVPDEFVVQPDTNANPPTLFLAVEQLLPYLTRDGAGKADKEFLRRLYPRLATWYAFFNTTQAGLLPGTYRWRGRDSNKVHQLNPLTLSSGLDDYPRASHPTDEERHLDLLCWMAMASRVMAQIGFAVDAPDWRKFSATWESLRAESHLDKYHWSEQLASYYDYGLHSERVRLERPQPPKLKPGQPPPQTPPKKIRRVDVEPRLGHVPGFGYVSLFPMLMRLLQPGSPRLGKILTDLADPKLLWTAYGLRSLSPQSSMYNRHNTEDDPPYWRGAIWINANYLAVTALRHYASQPGPHRETAAQLAERLRTAVFNNVMKEWDSTGFLWEQYEDRTGRGQRTHPFCGWTALAALLAAA
ncbi:hypothetical protein BOX15_Mlig018855g3, partial [Macrostomum lignano]